MISGSPVTWTSGAPGVATVNNQGRVTAVKNGSAVITARSGNATAAANITVSQTPGRIVIEPQMATLMSIGATVQLSAAVQDRNQHPVAGAEVTWQSSDEGIASVSNQGLVTAVGNGTVRITARAGNVSAGIDVKVMQEAGSITIEPQTAALTSLGETVQLAATVLDERERPVEGAVVTWTSSDESVATVSDKGLVTAVGNGTALISVRSGSVSDSIEVTVTVHNPDVEVLTLLYNETGGPSWINNTNWLSDEPLENWHGVTTNVYGRITELDLSSNGLEGELPSELGQMTEMKSLNFYGNKLSGVIPSSVGQMTDLRRMYLNANQLSGSIPSELGNLPKLTRLGLSENQLTGSIPDELGNLVYLISLNLEINELSGPIPATLGNLTKLTYLSLLKNNLSGSIPPELGRLSKLERFRFSSNDLTGSLPPELGQLDKLINLDVSHNELTGVIPPELGGLSSLVFLHLESNRISGPIPHELGNLSNLESMWMQDNELTGPIPRELGKLSKVYFLYLSNNRLTGVIPPELSQMTDLKWLYLSNNRLSGTIPSELGQLSSLQSLSVQDNVDMYGTLPRSLINLDLNALWLNGTQLCAPSDAEFQVWLSGVSSVRVSNCTSDRDVLAALYEGTDGPNWVSRANWLSDAPLGDWAGVTANAQDQVTALVLENNNMRGSLPPALGGLPGLKVLNLTGNDDLNGPLPRALVNLNLDALLLEGSNLCAPDDEEIQNWLGGISDTRVDECAMAHPDWNALDALYTSTFGQNWTSNGNWLSARPMNEWYGITTDETGRVTELRLEYNNLWGALPPELGQLTRLRSLSITGNRLTGGPIPSQLGELTSLEVLRLTDNQLSGNIPTQLGGLSSLAQLDLARNSLDGGIPHELGSLANLQILILDDNNLSQTIPAELGRLSDLSVLSITENQLSGEIPSELGELSMVQRLNLSDNGLSGTVPPGLGRLTNLVEMSLAKNRLSGGIPATLGGLSSLAYLSFTDNQLTGSLPGELGNLSNLRTLGLGRNSGLSGPLPQSFTGLQLDALLLDGTMLCVPSDDAFQTWVGGIPNSRVAQCIRSMTSTAYLTQAVQSLAYPVPLVAGEPALLRVFVTAGEQTDTTVPPVRATFYHGGEAVHVVESPGLDTAIPGELIEADLATSINARVPGDIVMPGLDMVVEIDPDGTVGPGLNVGGRIPSEGSMEVVVREVPPLDLTLVPFIWTENPDMTLVSEVNGLTAEDELFRLTRDLLPVGDFNVRVRDALMTSYDPILDNSIALLEEILAIRAMDGAEGYYMGVLTAGGGRAYVPGTSSVSILDGAVIAHELGHNMNLQHANCGGLFLDFLDPDFPNNDGTIDSWGYDFQSGQLVHPESPDLMSYCRPPWISDYNFTRALSYRVTEETRAAAAYAHSSKGLLLWGRVDEDGMPALHPAFVVDAPSSVPRTGGPYRLTGIDREGGTLFSFYFNMARIADGEGSSFAFVIPVTAGWRHELERVELSGPGGVATIDGEGGSVAALLRDRYTGEVRGILRDWPGESADLQAARRILPEPGLDVITSAGIPDPADWE